MNTVTKINLSKLRSCNQVWDDMPVNEQGRLCLKCSNTIIDFRNMSDADVAHTHVFSTHKICGVYNEAQLAIPNRQAIKKPNKWLTTYAAICSLISVSNYAQSNKKETPTEQTDQKTDSFNLFNYKTAVERDSVKTDSVLVKGKITDETGEPKMFANVIIKGTNTGTTSDFDGNYLIKRTDAISNLNNLTLQFSSIGYVDQELVFASSAEMSQIINVSMKTGAITNFVVTARRRTFLGRTWQGIKGIFKKKD